MSLVRQMRGGKDYDATFGKRKSGTGVFADLIEKRFEVACKRFGLNEDRARGSSTRRSSGRRARRRRQELF